MISSERIVFQLVHERYDEHVISLLWKLTLSDQLGVPVGQRLSGVEEGITGVTLMSW